MLSCNNTTKPKVLFVNEATYLNSGYGTYGREIMKRLYATQKYDLYELASFGHFTDSRVTHIPWGFYGNLPDQDSEEQQKEYENGHYANKFGKFRFDEVVLDLKPDFVVSIRDPWMDSFIADSHYRNTFVWACMPTVDSAPQQEDWLGWFKNVDHLCTYTEFGKKVLETQSAGELKVAAVLGGGASKTIHQPIIDKKGLRKALGLSEDLFIIGTVMRNQKRKLYPDLLKSFEMFCEQHPALAKKAYLYWHTSHPDVGWDIPWLLKNSKVGHKVMFTYACRDEKCGNIFVGLFQDERTFCPKCKQYTAALPNTKVGISDEVLGQLYNVFDIYIQYAIAEGIGVPACEASMCGIPLMVVNYSGMEDFVTRCGAIPVNVGHFFLETETQAYRCYPDKQDFVDKLAKFMNLPSSLRSKKGFETRQKSLKNFDYDVLAKGWEKLIDKSDFSKTRQKWFDQPNLSAPNTNPPQGMTHEQCVEWAINNIANRPELIGSYVASKMVKDLNYGAIIANRGMLGFSDECVLSINPQFKEYKVENMFQDLANWREAHNYWEQRRVGMIQVPWSSCIVHKKEPYGYTK